MNKDVTEYISACPACSQSKSLQLLTISHCCWLDIEKGLGPSDGNTIITVIDQFSKVARCSPLPILTSIKETAVCFFSHVSRYHGFPKNVMSDQDTQFFAVLGGVLEVSRSHSKPVFWVPRSI